MRQPVCAPMGQRARRAVWPGYISGEQRGTIGAQTGPKGVPQWPGGVHDT